MHKKIIDQFTIGGTKAGASMPGVYLQAMIGKEIAIDMIGHKLLVPVDGKEVIAEAGDQIILYDDKTLEVIKNMEDRK